MNFKELAEGTPKRTCLFLTGILISFVILSVTRIHLTNDDYFMMANWRAVLQNGFYTTDPLSMHHTYRASVEKWLSCALLYYVYHTWGITGIYIGMALLNALIAYLIYILCNYTSGNRFMALLFTIAMFAMGSAFFIVRPQTVTAAILLIETLCLEHFAKEDNCKYLYIIPVLSWLEMQLHTTIWPCFFMVLIPYLMDFKIEKKRIHLDKNKTKALAISSLACFGSLFLNPYGAWSVFYIFRSYSNKYMDSYISELAKTDMFRSLMFIWVIIIAVALMFGNKKMPTRYWLLFTGLFFFTWTAKRNELFFDVIGAFPLCYMLRGEKMDFKYNLIPCIPIIAIGVLIPAFMMPHNTVEETDNYYVETIDKLAADYGVHGENIFCDFNAGSYAEYVGYHPYIDSRAEIFTKKINGVEELWKEYLDMTNGVLYYKDFVKKYNFKYLVVDKTMESNLYNGLLHDDDYRKLFQYEHYAVFTR